MRLLFAPLLPFAIVSVLAFVLPMPVSVVVMGMTFVGLLPMALHAILRCKAFHEPVPGFRSGCQAAVKGGSLCVASFIVALIVVFASAFLSIVVSADSGSLGKSPLSVTVWGLPMGAIAWLLPQFMLPTMVVAALVSALEYALVAKGYRRRLKTRYGWS